MKRYIAFLAIALALVACKKAQPTGEQYQVAPALETSSGTVQFDAQGGSSFVSVSTSGTVQASCKKEWVSVSVAGRIVTVATEANESIESRYATVTIKADGKEKNVQVVQFGYNTKYIWDEEYSFPLDGGFLNLKYVNTDATLQITIDGDGTGWITAEAADGIFTINVAKNNTKQAREGVVTWKAGEDQRVVTIKQARNPNGQGGGGGGEGGNAVLFSEDFEDVDKLGDWMLIDADGDDNYWNYSDQFASHSGIGVLFSQSYDNNTGALTPDNWVITPGIELASSDNYVSFWVTGQDPEWNSEHYGVYVCTSLPETLSDLNNFELLFEGTNPVDGAYEEEEATVVTSQGTNIVVWQHIVAPVPDTYNGKTVYVAFRHFNCTDMFYLNLDDVSVTKGMPEKTVTSAPALASVKPSRTVSPDSARK